MRLTSVIYLLIVITLTLLTGSTCRRSSANCSGLPTPFNLSATPSSNEIRLTWQGDSTNIGAYRIERAPSAGGPFQLLVWAGAGANPGVHSFSFADGQVQPCVQACYRLASQHVDGTVGCLTAPVCATVGGGNSNEVRNVRVVAWSQTEFRITWEADPAGIQNFQIERANGEQSPYQPRTQVAASGGPGVQSFSFADQQIQIQQFGVKYCYRIKTQRSDGTMGCATVPVCAELVVQ